MDPSLEIQFRIETSIGKLFVKSQKYSSVTIPWYLQKSDYYGVMCSKHYYLLHRGEI